MGSESDGAELFLKWGWIWLPLSRNLIDVKAPACEYLGCGKLAGQSNLLQSTGRFAAFEEWQVASKDHQQRGWTGSHLTKVPPSAGTTVQIVFIGPSFPFFLFSASHPFGKSC